MGQQTRFDEKAIEVLKGILGIDFANSANRLNALLKLKARAKKLRFRSFEEYAHRIEHNPVELNVAAGLVANNNTSFFREYRQLCAIYPALQNHDSSEGPFRIWCAGCSTGEEAYTFQLWQTTAWRTPGIMG